MTKRILIKEIEMCNDCPLCSAFSIDGIASASCGHEKGPGDLPAEGKTGTEIMCMEIPDECPLDKVEKAEQVTDVLGDISKMLSLNMAMQNEKLIKDAISHVIGHKEWAIVDIAKRGLFTVGLDGIKIFSFDGIDLIEFHPMVPTIDGDLMGLAIKETQNYRLLYGENE